MAPVNSQVPSRHLFMSRDEKLIEARTAEWGREEACAAVVLRWSGARSARRGVPR